MFCWTVFLKTFRVVSVPNTPSIPKEIYSASRKKFLTKLWYIVVSFSKVTFFYFIKTLPLYLKLEEKPGYNCFEFLTRKKDFFFLIIDVIKEQHCALLAIALIKVSLTYYCCHFVVQEFVTQDFLAVNSNLLFLRF